MFMSCCFKMLLFLNANKCLGADELLLACVIMIKDQIKMFCYSFSHLTLFTLFK